MKWSLQLLIGIITLFCQSSFSYTLKVAADISLREILSHLSQDFTGTVTTNFIELNFAPSGVLRKNINEENWDIIIMASKGEIDLLSQGGIVEKDSIKLLAKNRLILVTAWPRKNQKSWMELAETEWKRIILASPDTSMSGVGAQMLLEKEGFLDSLKGKIIYEKNSEKVLEWVKRAKADAGFIYQSDLIFLKPRETFSLFEIDDMLYSPIQYYGAILKKTGFPHEAQTFLNFIASQVLIWEKWGFERP